MLYLGNNEHANFSTDLPKEGLFESKSCCGSRMERLERDIKLLKKVSMIDCKSQLE